MINKRLGIPLSVFLIMVFHVGAGCQDRLLPLLDSCLMNISREYTRLNQPPYFMDIRVHDIQSAVIHYSSGILASDQQSHDRIVSAGIRIGSYEADNTAKSEDQRINNQLPVYSEKLTIEDDSLAICSILSQTLQTAYDQSLQQYKALMKSRNSMEKMETIPAFSIEKPAVYFEAPEPFQLDEKAMDEWKRTLTDIIGQVENDSDIVTSEIAIMAMHERIYYLSTEGTRVVQNRPQYQIQVVLVARTVQGTMAPVTRSFIGRNMNSLPSPGALRSEVQNLHRLLTELKKSPMADPYAGPAILSPEAAGVFFHEIFGHRIEGQRLNSTYDSQTFKERPGKPVIDDHITIVSDPTLKSYKDKPLFGSYVYDDEGVPARPVTVVEKGILKEFLMSRTPVRGQLQSNGHGRTQAGSAPFSRQSNLIVTSDKSMSESALRKLLLRECKKQGKAYGYYIKEVYGGFTSTDLFSPQVFNIMPTVVYRVYTNGREELVRGTSFIGTPLTVFSEIIGAGDRSEVFSGFCGAESGNIPVSTISPGLLIKKIEIQKMPESRVIIPLMPSPAAEKPYIH
jgi:TldD protein